MKSVNEAENSNTELLKKQLCLTKEKEIKSAEIDQVCLIYPMHYIV